MLTRMTVEQGVECLRSGGVLVFPTETSYALGCAADNREAVARIVAAKARPGGKPLPVLLPSIDALRKRNLESPLTVLAEAFWPGPLTLVVPAFPGLAPPLTSKMNMVGVRMSSHPIAKALVFGLGGPLVATSANRSGQPAAYTPAEVDAAEISDVDGFVDGGALEGGASTVVGMVRGDLEIFRQGPISEAQLRAAWRPGQPRS